MGETRGRLGTMAGGSQAYPMGESILRGQAWAWICLREWVGWACERKDAPSLLLRFPQGGKLGFPPWCPGKDRTGRLDMIPAPCRCCGSV